MIRINQSPEEVVSHCRYPSAYSPKSLYDQVSMLMRIFPAISRSFASLERPLPDGAEGWFAIPKWQTIASTYGEAVEKVLAKVNESRKGKFKNWREGELGPDRLKQSARTEKMFEMLAGQQKGYDILVVAAQFGMRHRGRSVRRAREVMQANECGLGAFAVGIMLITHPERLMHYADLCIDCAGDEYAPRAEGGFARALFFLFDSDRVWFDAYWFDGVEDRSGSASAFLLE